MLEVFMNILTLFAMTVMLALVSMELYLAQVIHFKRFVKKRWISRAVFRFSNPGVFVVMAKL